MRIEKISQAQKKIILDLAVALAALLIFLLLAYLPSRKAVRMMASQLEDAEKQINEIEAILGSSKSMDEGMQLLRQRFQKIDARFSLKQEDSLRLLSEGARRFNVEIISVKPQAKTAFLDEKNNELSIEGKACMRLPVSLEMRSSYKDLVRYLRYLRDSYPALTAIERLRAAKDQSGLSRLNVSLDIELYLFQ